MPDRRVVGNSVTVSLVAVHRNGRDGDPVAAVEFRATDGSNSITPVVVSALTATVDPLTGNVIQEYIATLDITSLTNNSNVTVNAKVFPWIGGSGSVTDSADLSSQWEFSPRTFRKSTGLAAAPVYIYVKSTGSDAAGVAYVGTNASSANAAPALTITGAINRARAALGATTGDLNGLIIRLDAGTWSRASTPTANTVNAAVVIEPIPGVSKASCIFQFGAANNSFGLNYVHLRGLTIQRAGAFYLNGVAGTTTVQDCDWDWGGFTATVATSTQAAHHYFINVAFAATTAGISLSEGTNPTVALMRGCTGGAANSGAATEMLTFIGNTLWGVAQSVAARSQDNRIIAFNKLLGLGNSGTISLRISLGTTVTGYALVQNILEWTSTGDNRAFMPSGDGATVNVTNLIVWHNTILGFNALGRGNILYDESSATTRRTHKLQSFVGNIHVQINTKSDVYAGLNAIADAPNRTGNWGYNFGVGVRGEFARYRNAGNSMTVGFNQDYPGIASVLGTINTGAGLDPLFTSYAGTTSGPTAGAGGGTYTLTSGSPAEDLVANSPLPYDLVGTLRAANDNAGAYAHGVTLVTGPVGRSDETDTTFAQGSARPAGIAVGTNAAFALGAARPVARATETDTAIGLSSGSSASVGLASEVNAALTLTAVLIRGIGRADTANTGLALSGVQIKAFGLGLEVDTARGLGVARPVGIATELDASLSLSAGAASGAGLANEADGAVARAGLSIRAVGAASETGTAFALTPRAIKGLGLATEQSVALTLPSTSVRPVLTATELSTAFSLTARQVGAAQAANEQDEAIGLLWFDRPPPPPPRTVTTPSVSRIAVSPQFSRIATTKRAA